MITGIFIASQHDSVQQEMTAVKVTKGKGIVGDRHYGLMQEEGQNITFVESEAIQAFNEEFGQVITLSDTRRNIVTQGVSLNQLVGKEFSVGTVRFYGVELCEPCAQLGQKLATSQCHPAQVVAAWHHRGGLRADVLSSGVLGVGDIFDLGEGASL
ncbi:MOSC domain-containing protein [Marinomonas epiphytica]